MEGKEVGRKGWCRCRQLSVTQRTSHEARLSSLKLTHFFSQRCRVPKHCVRLVWSALRVALVQQLLDDTALFLSPRTDGRSSPDLGVLLHDLGRPSLSYAFANVEAKRARDVDNLAVAEETL